MRTMRSLIVAVFVLVLAGPASAQEPRGTLLEPHERLACC